MTVGVESSPISVAMDAAGLDRALELVKSKNAAAQLCVIRDGQVVLDRAFGCRRDAMFLIYSSSKPFVALLVHLLAQRGLLSLDDPVAAHWPEYSQHGKGSITVRHVLQHRAGVPVAGGLLRTMLHLADWERSVRDAERARPRWPAGKVPAYHVVTYGFILGELVRRVTGRPVRDFLTSELLVPLGLNDVHLGLPSELWSRHVPIRAEHRTELINELVFNRRKFRQAVIPAINISTTAYQLARFYQMLLRGGQLDGVRVLDEETIAEARRPSSEGEVDAFTKRPVRWAQGLARVIGPAICAPNIDRARGDPARHRSVGRELGATLSGPISWLTAMPANNGGRPRTKRHRGRDLLILSGRPWTAMDPLHPHCAHSKNACHVQCAFRPSRVQAPVLEDA